MTIVNRVFSRRLSWTIASLTIFAAVVGAQTVSAQTPPCQQTVKADVVALDQAFYNNRIGAFQAGGMIYALRRDVVSNDPRSQQLQPGRVMVRADKRPRPMVLRVNEGDCLEITFENLLGNLPRVFNSNSNMIRIAGDVINNGPSWAINGQALPAAGVTLRPGDTVSFDILNGKHGLLFNSEAEAKSAFEIVDGQFQTFTGSTAKCGLTTSFGTIPQTSGHIATLKVKQTVTLVDMGFLCSQHCQNMKGVLALRPGVPDQQYPVQTQTKGYQPNSNAMLNQNSQNGMDPGFDPLLSQPPTRLAGVHAMGLELVSAANPNGSPPQKIAADGSWVGANDVTAADPRKRASGLIGPGEKIVYTYYAKSQGSYLLYSTGADVGTLIGFGSQLMAGLFGSVTVQPESAEWYRSQVTRKDLLLACQRVNPSDPSSECQKKDGHLLMNYDAVYPANHPRQGQPILKMLNNGEIIYSDLTAIITGPNHGNFKCPDCPDQDCNKCSEQQCQKYAAFCKNPSYPAKTQPFREFAIHYHDDFTSTQAFDEFRKHKDGSENSPLTYTVQAGRDFFAINYGMGGIGPQVLANRIGVGPMHQCATCRFEEFFLTSWTGGDPAMVVDYPANAIDPNECDPNNPTMKCAPKKGPKATKAFYPDDPSNVYHSYMSDHVKFQILHAGTNISHVHHLHAHQWLHSPNSAESSYRDSQMISPGGSYTLEHVYNGSGNKNKTVGDSIFHCHFYPHFAQGMWALWRVHDVFEEGTELVEDGPDRGKPKWGKDVWNRALPDGEIATGTPIPAIVPMPGLPMAPIPAKVQIVPVKFPNSPDVVGYKAEMLITDPNAKNGPGFPFFIPGVAGQRPPHPPLDFAPDDADPMNPYLNGGLPRFIALEEKGTIYEKHNRWDFTKLNDKLLAVELAENGTPVEQIAMRFHATRKHASVTPEGKPGDFILNGRPAVSGAPFADPAVKEDGTPVCPENKPPCLMRYKAANLQLDLVFSKKGFHFPQSRLITLWGDVQDTLDNKRPAQPFFFRANSDQVIEYWLANLVPNYYELDDFQVRTPTDIIGQHIHLVKFDVTSADGAANGYNYEDGTLSPIEVQDLIKHINKAGGLYRTLNYDRFSGNFRLLGARQLKAKSIPYFGPGKENEWLGAQATIQRWYADPVKNNNDVDRTLRTVFTHDHFGPSTHQQVGLYAGLLVEPTNSKWVDPVTGEQMGTRVTRNNDKRIDDGGPTNWQALIITQPEKDSYREFALEFQDRQLAYTSNTRNTQIGEYKLYPDPNIATNTNAWWGWPSPGSAISAPADQVPTNVFAPFPNLVTQTFQTGTYSVNYRSEPLAYRVNTGVGTPTAQAADLSYVFQSITRGDPTLNLQPTGNINPGCSDAPGKPCFKFPPAFTGAIGTDPYTPLLRAYAGDNVQVRVLVGAHMSPNFFTIHGANWLFEPTTVDATDNNTGYRSTQGMGISEHYEMLFKVPRNTTTPTTPAACQNGPCADYLYLASSDTIALQNGTWGILRAYGQKQTGDAPLMALPNNVPPATASPVSNQICPTEARQQNYTVVAAFAQYAFDGPLVYNKRGRPGAGGSQKIVDPTAIVYYLADPESGAPLNGHNIEPLILRAGAGDCINVTLINKLPTLANQSSSFGITIKSSNVIGLHPQLVSYDVTKSNGVNVGINPSITVNPGDPPKQFQWYAGNIEQSADGATRYKPVEFGSIPLTPSDPLMQHPYGLLGALVIEPQGSTWQADENSQASATVTKDGKSFREFVGILQDDVANLALANITPPAPGNTIQIVGTKINGSNAWGIVSGGTTQPLPASGVILNPGDTVTFDVVQGQGTHGLLFDSESQAKQVFDIVDGAFQTFASQCSKPNSYGTVPQTSGHIGTLKVKQAATLTSLPFECSQHCQNMTGAFSLSSGPADIQIVGTKINGSNAWGIVSGGTTQPLPPSGVKLNPGDTVTFSVVQGQGTHGLLFDSESQAKSVFDVVSGAFQTFASQCSKPNSYGTVPQTSGQIAKMTVKQSATLTSLPFECSQHCQNMTGAFSLGSAADTIQIVATLNSSNQPVWNIVSGGQNAALPPTGVILSPGNTVSFDIAANGGTNGIMFTDQVSVNTIFDIVDGTFSTNPQGAKCSGYGTAPQASGHMATLKVKQKMILENLPFQSSQNCTNMTGTFALGPKTTPAPGPWTKAFNYRTEPMDYRFNSTSFLNNTDSLAPLGISRALSNILVLGDPQTPVFAASAGQPVRMRMIHPGGILEQIFTLHGHVWQEAPYTKGSTEIGDNPKSISMGSRDSFGANVAFDVVLDKAGGDGAVPGDYLFRTFTANDFRYGLWGVLRVGDPGKDIVTVTMFSSDQAATGGNVYIAGVNTVNPNNGKMAKQVTITMVSDTGVATPPITVNVDGATGMWPTGGSSGSCSPMPCVQATKMGTVVVAPASVKTINVTSVGEGGAVAVSSYIPILNQNQPGTTQAVTETTTAEENETNLFRAQPDVKKPAPGTPQPTGTGTGTGVSNGSGKGNGKGNGNGHGTGTTHKDH